MKGSMERVLSTEVEMMYPKKWILLVNLQKEKDSHCFSGEIYWIADTKDELHIKKRAIGETLGETLIVEGFNDTPQIGGLEW